MSEMRCTYKEGWHNCGSYAFNLWQNAIDQGDFCDVHFWQNKCTDEYARGVADSAAEITAQDTALLRECLEDFIAGEMSANLYLKLKARLGEV
jgi:hypothetical protein